jgi:hypothetical protein
MYNGRSGGEELGLLDLELGDLLDKFEVPFVQLFLLVADDRVASRDFGLEGRDSGAEGSVLLFYRDGVSVHASQVEHPVFRVFADVLDERCCGVGVRRGFWSGSHRVGDDRPMGRSYVMSRPGQAGRPMTVVFN